jgi:hypothetical protein
MIMVGVAALLTLAKDAAFITWSRRRLCSDFRAEASRAIASSMATRPGAGAAVVPLPPVLSNQ